MALPDVSPRTGALAALLGLLPVAAFLFGRGDYVVAVALVNVVLIFGSLYVALSPVEGGHGHGENPH
ncbi:cytochrome-ba3 oxidase subunit [Halobacteriales archaeon Cl-PHB]